MPKIPFDCGACSHRFPGHDANCVKADHPAICGRCGEPLYVSYAGRLARHFSNEETSCPPKKEAA